MTARGWRVRSLDFLSLLRAVLPLSQMCGPLNIHRAVILFPQPGRPSPSSCACRYLRSGVSPGAVDAQNQQAESSGRRAEVIQRERTNVYENYRATPRYHIGAQTTY
jgi:hypothetical protein